MSNVALNRTVASCYENGSTNIPLPKSLARPGTPQDKWKARYEEAEKKRKNYLTQCEKSTRELHDLERRYKHLQLQNTVVESELADKSEQLRELRTVSQNLYREYNTLKNQYDLETGAMHSALREATKWYKQNRELKRQSAIMGGSCMPDVVDNADTGQEEELAGLRESVKELSANNARLQTELNEAKLSEFEATEQVVNFTQELEALQNRNDTLESELRNLRNEHEQTVRVSKMLTEELTELRDAEKRQRETAVTLRYEADDARKERNVLAHQSTLLLQGIALDDDRIQLFQEIENLKRQLEDMGNKYDRDITQLQEKLEEKDNDSQQEILEERLKLAESELQQALEKCEEYEKKCSPPPPPPPPPLPPMAPPMPVDADMTEVSTAKITLQPVSLRQIVRSDMKDTSGEPPVKKAAQPAIDNIINQIKGGQFTLKSTRQPKKEREEPKAVSEMLKILGTLRKSPKAKCSVASMKMDVADVRL